MTAADCGSKRTKRQIKGSGIELILSYSCGDRQANRCRKRAAVEELPLRQIFDDRTVDAGDNEVALPPLKVRCTNY